VEHELILTPTDFVAIANQVFEHSMPFVYIEGELANFKISKNKWLYFDLKDDYSKINCFGSVYALPGVLQDGMMLKVSGQPRLHPQFGFSLNVQAIQPSGEGTIKKAYDLLKAKLQKEGLFEISRKRSLPYPPRRIVLVASGESAGYSDFIKIVAERWPNLVIELCDVQVQGVDAPNQIISAIDEANKASSLADVLVLIRGGGSMDDLIAFNDERLVRAISASRITTLVAIGHERDELLAELAADKRASTPSNAAELLVPNRHSELLVATNQKTQLSQAMKNCINIENQHLSRYRSELSDRLQQTFLDTKNQAINFQRIISAYNPAAVLKRGFAIVRQQDKIINSALLLDRSQAVEVQIDKGKFEASINKITLDKEP